MAEIKISISLLCKHLNFLFDMNTKPEMFRLAKFNKSDDNVVEIFWSILKNMIQLSDMDNIVQSIKKFFLLELKYENVYFYSLPEDMSSGSRELLIALGYILANNYLDKLVENVVVNSPLNPNFQMKTSNAEPTIENYSFNLKQFKTEDDFEHAIQWIKSRADHNRKLTKEYQSCCEKMSEKLSKTVSNTIPNMELSVSQILAFSNVEYAKDFLENTETVLKVVQNHERWLKTQSVFWDWMDSVLVEKQKDTRISTPDELDTFFGAFS